MTAIRPMLTHTPTRRPRTLATALALAALTTLTGPAHAENECGALDPANDAGRSITCTGGEAGTYDATSDGNVLYELPNTPTDADYSLTLDAGTAITGRRNAAQVPVADQTDDHSRRWNRPGETWANYGAVFVVTGFDHRGNLTLRSAADITAGNADGVTIGQDTLRARGIYARHIGRAGDIAITLTGGTITSTGSGVHAEIDSLYSGRNTGFPGTDIPTDARRAGDIAITLTPGVAIRTSGQRGHGIEAAHRGHGTIRVTATGTPGSTTPDIMATGPDAGGINVEMGNWWAGYRRSETGAIAIDLTDYHIRTTGDRGAIFGSGVKAYNYIPAGTIDITLTGSTIATQGSRGLYALNLSGGNFLSSPGRIAIDVTDSTITSGRAGKGHDHAIIAQHQTGAPGTIAITATGSTLTTRGSSSSGLYGRHFGIGDVTLTTRGNRITTAGDASHGLYGHKQFNSGVSFLLSGDLTINARSDQITTAGAGSHGLYGRYEGSSRTLTITARDTTITTAGAGSHGLYGHRTGSGGAIAITLDGGTITTAGTGIVAAYGSASSSAARVEIRNAARITATEAVRFENSKADLALTDVGIRADGTSTLIGSISFAAGTYDDVLTLTQTTRSGRYDGSLDFLGGDDTLALDIARGQHFIFGGEITNLETLTLQGGGFARFAAPVNLVAPGTATVTDGTLVLASGLTSRTVTISAKGRLVLEAGLDSSDQLTYGQIASGTVHFAGDPVVFAQLAPDLTADQIRTVRERLAAASLTRADLLPTTLTQGDDNTDLTMGTIVIRSTQADGTVVDVGTIAADGTITLDANRIAQLRLPEGIVAAPRHRLVAALPAVLLDMTALEAPSAGPGTWARLLGSTADRTRKDATVPTAYDLVRRGVALGHGLELGPGRTLGLAVQHQTGSATVTNGGTIDVTATTLGVRHAWALEATTLGVAASATTLASDLAVTATGRLAAGLSGTGLTAGLRADHRLALPDDATVTLGADLTHARVKADAFTTEAATKEQATAIKGSATTLALTADWTTPRPTGAVFAGARLALPLGGTAQARVGTTALTSKPRPALGVQGGIAFGGTAITLGYGRESGGDSLAASLTHRF